MHPYGLAQQDMCDKMMSKRMIAGCREIADAAQSLGNRNTNMRHLVSISLVVLKS